MFRSACVTLLLTFLGCQSFPPSETDLARVAAERLWAEGQAKMQDGRHEEAISDYERSLAVDPGRAQTMLSLAAAELEKGDKAAACRHLAQYVAARPNDLKVRAYY